MSLIYILNSVGDKHAPWGTPDSSLNFFFKNKNDFMSLITLSIVGFEKKGGCPLLPYYIPILEYIQNRSNSIQTIPLTTF